MKKIRNLISILLIICITLCGCDESSSFDEPAFIERYEEITDALFIACTCKFSSNDYEWHHKLPGC